MKKFYIEPEFDCLLLSSLEDILTSNTSVDIGSGGEYNDGNMPETGGDNGDYDDNPDDNWE